MRRVLTVVAAVSSAALIGVVAGCGSSDATAPTGPAGTTAPAATTAATSSVTTAASGGIAAGEAVFVANCQGCHPAGGTEAGAGPQLSSTPMDAAAIATQVREGSASMPGGLVSGADLEDVVAYVESIRK